MRHLSGFKVLVSVFLASMVGLSLVAAPMDNQTRGMGSVGVSLSDHHTSMYSNPAALFFRGQDRDSSFYVSVNYEDLVNPWDNGQPCDFIQRPLMGLDLSFAGKYIALTLQVDNFLDSRQQALEGVQFNGYYSSLIRIDFAYGYKFFGVGGFISGGNRSLRENVFISAANPFFDYMNQTLFSRYYAVDGSEFFNIGLGIQLSYEWVSLGVVTESIVKYSGSESLVFSGETILETLSCGFSFKSPTYTKDNELSLFVIEAACDFYHLGSNTERQVRLGVDMVFQLLPQWKIHVRTGFKEYKPVLSQLFMFSADNAKQTFGLGAQLDTFEIDLFCEVPLNWYFGTQKPGDVIPWSVAVSFTI